MVMERVRAESAAIARQQVKIQAMTQAFEQEFMPNAEKVVEEAVKDKGEGSQSRSNANGFAWTQIDASNYNSAFEEGIGSNVLV